MASAPLTIIVGAGISGLACAQALKKAGQNVLLLEASQRPGGVIRSITENGYLFEAGPQSFSATPELIELCDELGLGGELISAPHTAPRYVLIEKQLVAVPLSPLALLSSRLVSGKSKFSLLRDVFGKSTPPEEEESIAAFVRRKFSAEILDRMAGPFVSGIYAGDSERLSLRAAFPRLYEAEKSAASIIRGVIKIRASAAKKNDQQRKPTAGLLSFRSGNETLVRGLANALGPSLRCGVAVKEVSRVNGRFRVKTQTADGSDKVECEQLVLAAPAGACAELLKDLSPPACDALNRIEYAPVAVVSLGYRREQVGHSLGGFGFLAPRSSGIRTLGSVWNSSLFPGRAPQGDALLTSFIGGATDPSAVTLSPDELVAIVHRELVPILQITSEPQMRRVTCWARAIPQYNLGHLDRLETIRAGVGAIPGLHLIGNYWNGPAIGACLEHSQAVAEQLRIR